jgi:hypothetical protein
MKLGNEKPWKARVSSGDSTRNLLFIYLFVGLHQMGYVCLTYAHTHNTS